MEAKGPCHGKGPAKPLDQSHQPSDGRSEAKDQGAGGVACRGEGRSEKRRPQTNLADFLIAYLNRRNASAWSKKARTGNLKEFNAIYNYLMENKAVLRGGIGEAAGGGQHRV